VDDFGTIFEVLAKGGPAALALVLFYVWREERKDKRNLQDKLEELQEKVLANAVTQTQTISKLEHSITALKDVLAQVLAKLIG